jgi:hypothetical protein
MAGGAIVISDEELSDMEHADAALWWPDMEMRDVRDMAIELLQLREEKRNNLQCWLADDTERGAFDDQEMAEEIADNLEDGGSTTEEILCSTRLPNRHMRVWLTGGEERDVHFEWVEKS